jgi:N-methylhydantoinase A/oxoprolinase/acetone carboxylase beta subunit
MAEEFDPLSRAPGTFFPGPAIVEERECTTVVGFHPRFQVDSRLKLVIERG